MVAYAPRGLIGVLTPQANTTVEPELAILLPPGFAAINARLTSPKPSIQERLVDYIETAEAALDRFADAPLAAAAFACTGASYLVGPEGEDRLVAKIEAARGRRFVTAARAVCDALAALRAKRIGLVSPYPAGLTEASAGYWAARGFEVAEIAGTFNDGAAFHPIYSLPAGDAGEALGRLHGRELDAVVMLGTGMPTLGPILEAARAGGGPPVLSCMLALAWRSVRAAEGGAADAESLAPWLDGTEWGGRFVARRVA